MKQSSSFIKRRTQLCLVLVLTGMLVACGSSQSDDVTTTEDVTTEDPTDSSSQALVINEIVASGVDDESDWIEFYALSDISDLSEYSIVDDSSSHSLQTLPAIALSAGEYLVLQAIDETDTPPTDEYYVTFKLGGDDAVFLYKGSDLVDELDWEEGDAPEGYSYGLSVDGTGEPQTMLPTRGTANQAYTGEVVVIDSIINHNAELRINEVVAKDANGGEDWIELYVTGDEAVFLGDYTLTDSVLSTDTDDYYSLPDVTLAPGDFYRIYATDDDIDGESTVGFKLGSSDQVSLFNGTDLVDTLSWEKGQALINYSFGRFPDGSDAITTLTPTPLASNSATLSKSLVINEIVASQNDDTSDWFELYNAGTEDVLLSDYQVLDGSDDLDPITLPEATLAPGEFYIIYASGEEDTLNHVPFKLGKEDELSLIKNDETVDYLDWQDSDVSAGYSYGPTTDGGLITNTLSPTPLASNALPSVYNQTEVESIYFEIDEAEWQDLLDNAIDEEYHLTSVTYKGVTLDEVAIRTKGNSSLESVANSGGERFSFNIDVNEYVSGQRLLGMKKFVLNNMYNDPSYMREYIAYELFDEMGLATPRHSYVNVYVNNELKGLYLLVEFVNEDFIIENFTNTQGDLYKPDGTGSDLVYIDDDFASYSGVELKTNEDTSDNGAFMAFVSALEFGDAIDVIDEDSVLKYLSVSVALSNLDSYHGSLAHNYYIYEQDGEFSIVPWDLNESFGTFNQGCSGYDIRELYIDEPTSGALAERPLIAEVLASEDNISIYHDYLKVLINGALSSEAFSQRISDIDAMIAEHVANDPTAFYSYSQYQQNLTSSVGQFYGLTEFMTYRVNNMQQQLEGTIPSSGSGAGFCSR